MKSAAIQNVFSADDFIKKTLPNLRGIHKNYLINNKRITGMKRKGGGIGYAESKKMFILLL